MKNFCRFCRQFLLDPSWRDSQVELYVSAAFLLFAAQQVTPFIARRKDETLLSCQWGSHQKQLFSFCQSFSHLQHLTWRDSKTRTRARFQIATIASVWHGSASAGWSKWMGGNKQTAGLRRRERDKVASYKISPTRQRSWNVSERRCTRECTKQKSSITTAVASQNGLRLGNGTDARMLSSEEDSSSGVWDLRDESRDAGPWKH